MSTLPKYSRLLACAIMGTLAFAVGTAVAVTKDSHQVMGQVCMPAEAQVSDMGRIVVTARSATYVRPVENMGRFVVSQHSAVFVPLV